MRCIEQKNKMVSINSRHLKILKSEKNLARGIKEQNNFHCKGMKIRKNKIIQTNTKKTWGAWNKRAKYETIFKNYEKLYVEKWGTLTKRTK